MARDNDVIGTLWARKKVDDVLAPHLAELQAGAVDVAVKERVVALGKKYSIMTPFTSFVAVEKARVVSDGRPVLVRVPIELPDGTSWEGFFGDPNADQVDIRLEEMALGIPEGMPEGMDDETVMEDTKLGVQVKEAARDNANYRGASPPPPPPTAMRRGVNASASAGSMRGRSSRGGRSLEQTLSFGSGAGGGGGVAPSTGRPRHVSERDRRWYGRDRPTWWDRTPRRKQWNRFDADRTSHRSSAVRPSGSGARSIPLRLAVRSTLSDDLAAKIDLTLEEMQVDADGMVLISVGIGRMLAMSRDDFRRPVSR